MTERGRDPTSRPPAAISPAEPGSKREGREGSDRPSQEDPPPPSDGSERRVSERYGVTWSVDCETEDTFLYASISNISEMGIFVQTTNPLPLGTLVTLRFKPPGAAEAFTLRGSVQWVNEVRPLHDNPNPGMGIRFSNLSLQDRERIVETIRTIAYLREAPDPPN